MNIAESLEVYNSLDELVAGDLNQALKLVEALNDHSVIRWGNGVDRFSIQVNIDRERQIVAHDLPSLQQLLEGHGYRVELFRDDGMLPWRY